MIWCSCGNVEGFLFYKSADMRGNEFCGNEILVGLDACCCRWQVSPVLRGL